MTDFKSLLQGNNPFKNECEDGKHCAYAENITALPAFAVPVPTIPGASAAGALGTICRSDHQHQIGMHGDARHNNVQRAFYVLGPRFNSTRSYYVERPMASGSNVDEATNFMVDQLPGGFVSLVSVRPVLITGGGGVAGQFVVWYGACDWGADTEVYNANTGVSGNQTWTVPGLNRIYELPDFSALGTCALANIAMGDYVGLAFGRVGTDVGDTYGDQIQFLGFRIDYIANQ